MIRLRPLAPWALALIGYTLTATTITLWWRWEPVAATTGLLLLAMAVDDLIRGNPNG